MDRKNVLGIIGLIGTGLGWAASLLSAWATEQEIALTIKEEVKEQLREQQTDDENEEEDEES